MMSILDEQINEQIADLKRRRGITITQQTTVTAEEYLCKIQAESLLSIPNSFAYSLISGDVTVCDQQFTRFYKFINEIENKYKNDLQPLLFPIFIHTFMELISIGHVIPAHKYVKRHKEIFNSSETNKEIIAKLEIIKKIEDISKIPELEKYSTSRKEVLLSKTSLQILLNYLRREDTLLLHQILNRHCSIKESLSNIQKDEDDQQQEQVSQDTQASLNSIENMDSPTNELDEITRFNSFAEAINNGPPVAPSLYARFISSGFHEGVTCAIFNEEATQMACGYKDSAIEIWNSESIPCEARESDNLILGHSGSVYGISYAYNNQCLLSGSEDGSVRLWLLEDLSNLMIYNGHVRPVWDIAVHDSLTYFASASQDTTAKLWTFDRTFPIREFISHFEDINCTDFHPNGLYLATGSSDKSIRIWSLRNGKTIKILLGHRGEILVVKFSPDGKYLASSGTDCIIKVWDLTSTTPLFSFQGHTDTVYSINWRYDSCVLATGGKDGIICVWYVKAQHGSKNGFRCDNNLLSSVEPKCNNDNTINKNCVQRLQFASQGNALHSLLSCE
ncbi:DgyrCDS3896 [Dimorphilus gyrociliatus]|uniref:DgyrCDS3896 n=1 Tax=Dimorphilus gyrociliatus TaxID=2664684 RepID=A0A7I8VHG1_9ANNE|nr:DgyrCDS3896 [Dimorphilus gyrociliatus]